MTANDALIDKSCYSAFHNTDLKEGLRVEGIDDLITGGVMTNLCSETTARDAFVCDYRVFFVEDTTAPSNEEFHMASLKNLALWAPRKSVTF